jgi:predicted DNA-binding transcriptional regulator AlpA
MPPIPAAHGSPHHDRKRKPTTPAAPTAPAMLQRRQGDRDSADDAEAQLKILVRFKDLKKAGYVQNWPTLLRLIDEDGFPSGFMLGRNTRAWVLRDVEAWIAARPTARKIIAPRRGAIEAQAASS